MTKANGGDLSSVPVWWLSVEPIGLRLCLRPREPGERCAPPVGGFPLKTLRCEADVSDDLRERERIHRCSSNREVSAKHPPRPSCHIHCSHCLHRCGGFVCTRSLRIYQRKTGCGTAGSSRPHSHQTPGLKQKKVVFEWRAVVSSALCLDIEVKHYWRPFVPHFGWFYRIRWHFDSPVILCLSSVPVDGSTNTDGLMGCRRLTEIYCCFLFCSVFSQPWVGASRWISVGSENRGS